MESLTYVTFMAGTSRSANAAALRTKSLTLVLIGCIAVNYLVRDIGQQHTIELCSELQQLINVALSTYIYMRNGSF